MLATPRCELDAATVRDAVKGMGTDDAMLRDVLCTRSGTDIGLMKKAYAVLYEDRTALKDVQDDTSGNCKKLFTKILDTYRPDGKWEEKDESETYAEQLYDAGANKMGTDEDAFIEILGGLNRDYVEKIQDAYEKKYEKKLDKVIESEFGWINEKDTKNALRVLATPLPEYLADRLHSSMAGMGTDEDRLSRLLVSFRDCGLKEAADFYYAKYGGDKKQTLHDRVKSETSGDYQKVCLAIVTNFAT